MVDRLEAARRAVTAASDAAEDSTVREQLHSIDSGLSAVEEEPDDAEKGDRLEELEAKLVGLGDEADSETALEYIEDARDNIDAYRRDRAQDF